MPLRPLLPAALLAMTAWSGSHLHGASAVAVAAGHLALLGLAAWGWRDPDPLRLGRPGRWLPVAVWLLLLASAWRSPVSRAGALAVLLLPAFLALPATIARCWRFEAERRRGLVAVAAVVGLVAAAALLLRLLLGGERATEPLGHHLLLAVWLATLLPLATVPCLIARGPLARGAALVPPLLAAAALFASQSVAGAAGAVAGLAVLLPARRRLWLLPALAIGVAVALPRLVGVGAEPDASLLARAVYWRAAVAGAAERPLLGWGPGSTAWTAGLHLRPVPGTNPAGEVVGDFHSLPAQLLYELGAPAAAGWVLLVALFVARRRRDPATGEQTLLRRAGLAGLLGGLVTLLVTPTLATLAPWVALAVAAAAALAAAGPSPAAPSGGARRAAWVYTGLALIVIGRLDLAHAMYDRARAAPAAPTTEARRWLARAAALDPGHPLYRARLGWAAPSASGERAAALRLASDGAPGVATFALAAGAAAGEAGSAGAGELLARACAADPLAGRAPFLLALAAPAAPAAPTLAARAFLAEPGLVAAVDWERHPRLVHAAIQRVRAWHGVDRGYRDELARVATRLPRAGAVRRLLWTDDERPEVSLSLVAFRRLPWPRPSPLATVLVRLDGARRAGVLPAATALPTSAAAAFPPDCAAQPTSGSPGNPQPLRETLWKRDP